MKWRLIKLDTVSHCTIKAFFGPARPQGARVTFYFLVPISVRCLLIYWHDFSCFSFT